MSWLYSVECWWCGWEVEWLFSWFSWWISFLLSNRIKVSKYEPQALSWSIGKQLVVRFLPWGTVGLLVGLFDGLPIGDTVGKCDDLKVGECEGLPEIVVFVVMSLENNADWAWNKDSAHFMAWNSYQQVELVHLSRVLMMASVKETYTVKRYTIRLGMTEWSEKFLAAWHTVLDTWLVILFWRACLSLWVSGSEDLWVC